MNMRRSQSVCISGFPCGNGTKDRTFPSSKSAAEFIAAIGAVSASTVLNRLARGIRSYSGLSEPAARSKGSRAASTIFLKGSRTPRVARVPVATGAASIDFTAWAAAIRSVLNKIGVRNACVTVGAVAGSRIRVTVQGSLSRPDPFCHAEYFDAHQSVMDGARWAETIVRSREAE